MEHGKPYIKDEPHFHFSLSHSGDWVICAAGPSPVGADIEKIREIDLNIAADTLGPEEYRNLMSLSGLHRQHRFFDFWTLKEAYCKLDGHGMNMDMQSFSIRVSAQKIKVTDPAQTKEVSFKQYWIDSAYKLSVCGYDSVFWENPVIITINEIINAAMNTMAACAGTQE